MVLRWRATRLGSTIRLRALFGEIQVGKSKRAMLKFGLAASYCVEEKNLTNAKKKETIASQYSTSQPVLIKGKLIRS